jgi:carbamoyl-phosphate synthase large subunit
MSKYINISNEINRPTVLVTSVGAPPGLNVVRALVEANICDVIAADADPCSPGLHQFRTPNAVLPMASDTVAYLCELKALIHKRKITVILPCLEDEVEILAQYRAELEAVGVSILIPDADIVRTVTDKGRCTRIASDNGIDCPSSLVLPSSISEEEKQRMLKQFLVDTPLPWIIKPVWGHGMRGVTTVTSFDEALVVSLAATVELLVQELIPGPVGSMYLAGLLYDADGRVVRRFSSRSICTLYPTGGPATGGVSVSRPDMVEATERLVGWIGLWRGPLNAEWMLDPRDGKLKFIEINPRMWGYGYLATGSGLNLPAGMVSLALGKDIGPDPGFRKGVTLLRSVTDLIFKSCPYELKV